MSTPQDCDIPEFKCFDLATRVKLLLAVLKLHLAAFSTQLVGYEGESDLHISSAWELIHSLNNTAAEQAFREYIQQQTS